MAMQETVKNKNRNAVKTLATIIGIVLVLVVVGFGLSNLYSDYQSTIGQMTVTQLADQYEQRSSGSLTQGLKTNVLKAALIHSPFISNVLTYVLLACIVLIIFSIPLSLRKLNPEMKLKEKIKLLPKIIFLPANKSFAYMKQSYSIDTDFKDYQLSQHKFSAPYVFS